MLSGFRQFLLRGNVIDLAVAVVIGGAFGAVVTALVKDLLTPLMAAFVGDARFFGDYPHDQQQPVPDRGLRERAPVVRADRGGRVFRRRRSAERARSPARTAA